MPRISRQQVFLFGCAMLLVGQIYSPFVLSLSMWAIIGACLFRKSPAGRPRLDLPLAFKNLWKKPEMLAMTGLFWLSAVSGLWSDDLGYWLERTQVRLPFFVLPLAFANRPAVSKKQFGGLCALFLVAVAATGLGVLVNFALRYDEIMADLGRGGPVPVPRNHIRFGMLVAMGVAVGWQLFRRRFFFKNGWERWAWLAMAAFLFALSHILAVRSGLVAVYAVVLLSLAELIFLEKNRLIGLAALTAICLSAGLFIKHSPSLRTKLDYMLWDIRHGGESSTEGYSDTDRILSLRGGWHLFLESPVIGTGMGDLPAEMRRAAAAIDPSKQKDVKLPHNQFLYVLTATGVAGLLVSLGAWLVPFFYQTRPRELLFAAAMLILFTSFLVEYPIEGTYGAVFAAFFPLFFNMKLKAH